MPECQTSVRDVNIVSPIVLFCTEYADMFSFLWLYVCKILWCETVRAQCEAMKTMKGTLTFLSSKTLLILSLHFLCQSFYVPYTSFFPRNQPNFLFGLFFLQENLRYIEGLSVSAWNQIGFRVPVFQFAKYWRMSELWPMFHQLYFFALNTLICLVFCDCMCAKCYDMERCGYILRLGWGYSKMRVL